jgi:hypothetical protein
MNNWRFKSTSAVTVIGVLLLALWWARPAVPKEGWTNLRVVQGVTPYKQNSIVLDDQIWMHARRDLGDLRMFTSGSGAAGTRESEVPYALAIGRGSASAQRAEAKLLDLGRVNGETQFVIDMAGAPEYDQVELHLDGVANFAVSAHVEGLDSETQPAGEDLGSSVLFDFTHEGLGSDSTLKFHPSTHRFLRVRLPKIAPEQVTRAIAINTHKDISVWTPDNEDLPIKQDGSATIVYWEALGRAPVARVVFDIDPSQTNFWRDIQILTPTGGTITNSSIRRIHIVRDGILAESESVAVDLPNEAWSSFHLTLENGNDPPLKIRSAKAYAFERRIYFDPISSTALNLYYGNSYLTPPVYGYADNFRADPNAAIATLGPDMRNPDRSMDGAMSPRPPGVRQ